MDSDANSITLASESMAMASSQLRLTKKTREYDDDDDDDDNEAEATSMASQSNTIAQFQSRSADWREGHGSSPCYVSENGIFGSNNGSDSAVAGKGLCGSYDDDRGDYHDHDRDHMITNSGIEKGNLDHDGCDHGMKNGIRETVTHHDADDDHDRIVANGVKERKNYGNDDVHGHGMENSSKATGRPAHYDDGGDRDGISNAISAEGKHEYNDDVDGQGHDMSNGIRMNAKSANNAIEKDITAAEEPEDDGVHRNVNGMANDIRMDPKSDPGQKRNSRKRERGRMAQTFQSAVEARDWKIAESLIGSSSSLADVRRLNDGLCIVLDSVWFLSSREEVYGAIRLMEKLVDAGAHDFTRAALRTSFLASCVLACWSRTFSLADMEERLHERLQECSGHEMSKDDTALKVRQFTEWALRYIHSHSRPRRRGFDSEMHQLAHNTGVESQLQLRAFKRFLELAGNRLTGSDYTEAFDAACFPMTLFATSIDAGWAFGIASIAMQGLLGMLVEGGADNVNQCCLEAARFGSTDLLRILLQIAQRNGIEVDVDLALEYASQFCKIRTMECLVEEWNASSFLGPLMRAADRGCMHVVKWFVERGCRDLELCSALVAATSSSRYEVAHYLIKCIPKSVLQTRSLDILRATAERGGVKGISGSGGHRGVKGIAFLLQSDFLSMEEATYAIADTISSLEDGSISDELKSFCKEQWSKEAFIRGRKAGENHYANVVRTLRHGRSPLRLIELPLELQVAIAYLPLYRECAMARGVLLSQSLRGQLVEAISRLNGESTHNGVLPFNDGKGLVEFDKHKLLSILESRSPSFFVGIH